MSATIIQSSFQFGEVSELLHARVDAAQYNRSVKRLRNCVVIPQGGAKRRFGTVAVEAINNHAGSPVYLTNYRQVKPYLFDYEDGSRYLLIFRENAIDVYSNNVYQSTTTTTYAASEIESLSISQSASIIFITHGSHRPATLKRASTGPVVLTLNATPTFLNYPTFDFKQDYDTFTFQVIDTTTAAPLVVANNLMGRVVTLTSSAPEFDTAAQCVGGLFFAEGGVIRITAWTSTTSVTGRIIKTFDNDSSLFHGSFTILGADAVVTEIAFSSVRGYPQKTSFFQNRLFFAKTASLLGGVWGSNYNGYNASFLNFDDSASLATNAISTVIQGNKATIIQHLIAFKTLLVFTSSGLYSTPLLVELPLVPTNIEFINLQTADAANSVLPLVFDNDVVFFDKGGKKVKNVNVLGTTQHYETKNVSVLAPHLVDQPYSAGVFENSSTEDGNWLFMINNGTSRSGQLSIYQSVPEQEINAWSLATTDGSFRHVASDEETTYFIVERTINGSTRLFIEQLSFDAYMDCSVVKTQASSTTVTGLSHLEGETVSVRGGSSNASSAVMLDRVVTGGQITVEYAITYVQVGLNFTPQVTPNPLNIPLQSGNNLYFPKNIKAVFIDFFESLSIKVNGELIPPFRFNTDLYNVPIEPVTDFIKMEPMTGWDPNAEISITQSDPQPFTLIGIGFVVMI